MSKFIDSVKDRLTGQQKRAYPKPILFSPIEATFSSEHLVAENLEGYCVDVVYRQTGFCKSGDLAKVQENFIRTLRMAIYEDCLHIVLRLERASYEQDEDALRSAIRDLKSEVGL